MFVEAIELNCLEHVRNAFQGTLKHLNFNLKLKSQKNVCSLQMNSYISGLVQYVKKLKRMGTIHHIFWLLKSTLSTLYLVMIYFLIILE